ncbi:MAG: outer membrane family protein [Acidobacteria bacterium]|nr:outer membrane family protein [Acidobacteriota bacterium]
MKTSRRLYAAALALAMSLGALAAIPAAAQAQQYGALERGYRTGYSDGYQAGWTDQVKGARADYRGKAEYASADRAYIAAYGSLEDYRDGYQQGFEVGYEAGHARGGFNSELPAGGVRRRGASAREAAGSGIDNGVGNRSGGRPTGEAHESSSQPVRGGSDSGGRGAVSDVVLLVELQNRLSTDVSQRGDTFEARVLEPQQYTGATVTGRLSDVQRAGKARGRALLQLDFERIRMPGAADWEEFSGQVVEVLASEAAGVGEVDREGGVRGKGSTREDAAKVGAAAGVGAIIGAIAGGGKGAAIGAVIGGGAGTAGVMTQRGQDIRLEPGQQLRVRANGIR